ncbi:MAG: Gfo/Idh/MocA family protein [Bryobacteraceae bacterium]
MAEKQEVTRREVVQMAGAASVTAAASKLQGAPAIQKVKAANNQVQYGFIGTGSRGRYLLKHLRGIDAGRCVAICDLNEEAMRLAAELPPQKPAMHKDYRELLSRKDVDAVFIATPLYVHFPVTRDSLLAGKHTFCEKSMVFKPEEVHALRALAAQHPKQTLQVGLQRRYSRYYQVVKDMVDQGMLGTVTHIHAQWHRNPGWVMKQGGKGNPLNWRLFREYSGGLTAELASHQIDVADWMFGTPFDYVLGIGGLDTWKDGRDIHDNIQLIYNYPGNRKLVYSSIMTNSHLAYFGASRTEFGECIMGTGGCVEITVGSDDEPAVAIWFRENDPKVTTAAKPENTKAGATMVTGKSTLGMPVVLPKDEITGNESFWEKELKFARRWLYTKGILVPEEDRNPVDIELESFLNDSRTGARPKADVEVGLTDSTAVILSNLAMYEERRIYFNEINNMGRGGTPPVTTSAVRKS